jgi:hypothetical protein
LHLQQCILEFSIIVIEHEKIHVEFAF